MFWLATVAAERSSWTAEDLARRDFVAAVYQAEAPSLVRLARLFTDDRAGAEDIVQEAFIRLFHAADRIEDPDKSVAYLRSIVLNLARDQNRRGLMSIRHQDAMVDHRTPEAPDEQVARTESQAQVLDALSELSERQRACLVLRFYMELSEREIAETLRISPNSVKTHCRRGMEALAGRLEVAL
ncbi:MAG TPA: SigE family RNA polymerase sigma factor [Acidimicrobiia bacterium]|nr:SigE family RNA polymerase sigma factor [Acidimicrobiia bacterium]